MSSSNVSSKAPVISVVMSVYNGEEHVGAAIESIIAQSFGDFEFIIVNDGSKDYTPNILQEYANRDPRITIVHKENQGLTKSLNVGLSMAKGQYIARQDADDVAYPVRFERQIKFMSENPEYVLLGGRSEDVHEDGLKDIWPYHNPKSIQTTVYYKAPFPHSTAFMRARIVKKLNGYDESFKTAQDMDLWMRMAKAGKIAMLDDIVIKRHVGGGTISINRRWRQIYDGSRARMIHAPNPVLAAYHSLRSAIISSLPPRFIFALKAQMQ